MFRRDAAAFGSATVQRAADRASGFLRRIRIGREPLQTVFVVAPQNRGWILDAICRDLRRRLPGPSAVWYERHGRLPQAESYFFSHLSLYFDRAARLPTDATAVILFTHPSSELHGDQVRVLHERRPYIVCMATEGVQFLAAQGVDDSLLHHAIPGVDVQLFRSHRRGAGVVGFCSAFYERKNPVTLFEIVAAMPDQQFLLVGRGWEKSPWAHRIEHLTNLEYVTARYHQYPALYRRMDVFVSPSSVEGGPMPLLEAMMSNVVPVATRTGFAPDLIEHGENGFLTDTGSTAQDFVRLIMQARELRVDVRSSVAEYSLDRYAQQVEHLLRS